MYTGKYPASNAFFMGQWRDLRKIFEVAQRQNKFKTSFDNPNINTIMRDH